MQKTAAILRAEKKETQRKEQERIEEIKKSNPQAYIQSLYMKRKDLMDKLDDTKRKKTEFNNRYSNASQRRMQTIAILGIDMSKVPLALHYNNRKEQALKTPLADRMQIGKYIAAFLVRHSPMKKMNSSNKSLMSRSLYPLPIHVQI